MANEQHRKTMWQSEAIKSTMRRKNNGKNQAFSGEMACLMLRCIPADTADRFV